MSTNVIFSKFLALNSRDWIKGLVVSVLGAVLGLISTFIESGNLHFDWPTIGKAALLAGVAYITKNLFTNSKDEILSTEPK
jgi:TctA family transporter